MSDEPKSSEESMAWAFSVIYRMSQILNIPIEDAAKIYLKVAVAVGDTFTKKVN